MIHLRSIGLGELDADLAGRFPGSVPAIKSLAGGVLELTNEVTFFVGENGSGKSTLLEAIACAAGARAIGSEEVEEDRSLAPVRPLARQLRLTWSRRTHRGFFLRAEDFFGFARRLKAMEEELQRELEAVEREYQGRSQAARDYARMPYLGQLQELQRRYGEGLDARSHGEAFLTLFRSSFVPDGLYLLDEPEAPLSPLRQLTLIGLIHLLVEEQQGQCIIATHSPILMAYPGAAIYSFDGGSLHPVSYDDVPNVAVTRDFLRNPARYLGHLFRNL